MPTLPIHLAAYVGFFFWGVPSAPVTRGSYGRDRWIWDLSPVGSWSAIGAAVGYPVTDLSDG